MSALTQTPDICRFPRGGKVKTVRFLASEYNPTTRTFKDVPTRRVWLVGVTDSDGRFVPEPFRARWGGTLTATLDMDVDFKVFARVVAIKYETNWWKRLLSYESRWWSPLA